MPLKSSQNHELIWIDLLKDVGGSSLIHLLSTLYNKNHGYSNYKYCRRRDHTTIRKDVFNDNKIKQFVEIDSSNKKKVDKILDEMCHLLQLQNNPTRKLKIAGFPFLKCITNIYSNIYVLNHLFPLKSQNELGIDLFKKQYLEMSKELPIVILPTHRSYMDFLFISYIMFNNELPLPSVAAGDNFKAMGKYLCDYLKGTGAFLIRRNAHNKKDIEANAYYDVLRAYVHSMLKGGESPIEFFMEGTRTRSGQVLHPKTGLLSMVVDMYLDKLIEDIYILPVSINYQRPIEEQLYIAETTPELNKKKPKESAKNLITAFETIMKKKYGKVYVRFIEPFKLSQYFNNWSEINNHNSTVMKNQENSEDKIDNRDILQEFTNNLASKVCLTQAYHNILMPFNLMSFSIMYRIFFNDREKNSNTPIIKSNGFTNKINELNQKVTLELLMKDFQIIENLLMLSQTQFVPGWKSYLNIFDEFKIDRDGIIRPSSDRKYIELNYDSITFHTVQYYSNQVMQILLPVGICLLLSSSYLENSSEKKYKIYDKYKSIRILLEKEFLIDELYLQREFENGLIVIEKNQLIGETKHILVKHIVYFVESYLIFLNYIKKNNCFDRQQFFHYLIDSKENKLIQNGYKEQQNSIRDIFISKDMFKNMVSLVTDKEICIQHVGANNETSVPNTSFKKVNGEEKSIVKNLEKLDILIDQFRDVLNLASSVILN